MLQKIFDPVRFQGKLTNRSYFEGWYFKQVSKALGKTVSLIPGISLNPSDPHAFVQAIVSPPVVSHYFRYPVSDFHWKDDPFEVMVGPSRFSTTGCELHLKSESASFEGDVRYGPLTHIQKHWWMPNIMGFFAYLPLMECNHAVISMDHSVNGSVRYNDETIGFDGDRGYAEKDWGHSFPKRYVWVQANHFEQPGDSVMLSVADIPFLLFTFTGLIANFIHKGVEYRFATYNGARIVKCDKKPDRVSVELKKGALRLCVDAQVLTTGLLKAPVLGGMTNVIKEGLGGTVQVKLYNKNNLLCDLASPYAGIEIV